MLPTGEQLSSRGCRQGRPGSQAAARARRCGPAQPHDRPAGEALTSCCEEQGCVEIVGRQSLPLQRQKTKLNDRGPSLVDTNPAQDSPGTVSPPWALDSSRTPETRGRNRDKRERGGGKRQVSQGKSQQRLCPTGPSQLPWSLLPLSGRTARDIQLGQISNEADIWPSIHLPPEPSFSAASGLRWGNEAQEDWLPKPHFLA